MPIFDIAHWLETYNTRDQEVKIEPFFHVKADTYEEALEIMREQYLPQKLNDETKVRMLSKSPRETADGKVVDIYYYPGTSPFGESFGLIYCYAPILRERN